MPASTARSASAASTDVLGSRGISKRRRPTTSAADQRNVSPLTANTSCGLLTASRSPPRAGPRNVPTLSIVLDATFAAVSSAGVRVRPGSSAAFAGRKTVPTTCDTATVR